MTNKEAVNWIINLSADIGKSEHCELWHYEQALYEIREILESVQQWIPCSERLPEDYGTYICTCFDGCANRVTFVKWQNKLKQWILNGSRSYWKVITWMPLPEPYKEGDTE